MRRALARVRALLPEQRGAKPDGGASLWSFLPDAECLAAASLAREAVPDPALLCRSMVASTFAAGLELARESRIRLAQDEAFGTIDVHAVEDVRAYASPPLAAPEAQLTGAALGDTPAS